MIKTYLTAILIFGVVCGTVRFASEAYLERLEATALGATIIKTPTQRAIASARQNASLANTGADFQEFTKHLAKKSSIEDFLAALPEKFRERYVLGYESLSVQKGSYQQPRVIAFTPDSKLIYAFNGGDLEGGDKIEVIAFNDRSAAFEFYEISKGEKELKISDKNPVSCQRCHGSPARPNWQEYNSWPGFYGSNDDRISEFRNESREIKKFFKTAKTHARYKHLVKPETLFSTDRLSRTKGEMNIKFTESLYALNLTRVLSEAYHHSAWPVFKYQVLATALECKNLSDLATAAQKGGPTFEKYLADTQAAVSTSRDGGSASSPRFAAALRFFGEPLGFDIANWSTGFGFKYHFTMPSYLNLTVVEKLLRLDADMRAQIAAAGISLALDENYKNETAVYKHMSFETYGKIQKLYCDKKNAKLKELIDAKAPTLSQPKIPVVAKRCAQCHSDTPLGRDLVAPSLPFENPALMARHQAKFNLSFDVIQRTQDSAPSDIAMPPFGARLTPLEREQLIQYIEKK